MQPSQTQETHVGTITIRRLDEADRDNVKRLVQLDSGRPLEGDLLGIEVEGRLVAGISLSTGETIADPFSRTEEVRAMLELRAAQIRRRNGDQGRLARRTVDGHPRATLAGSPPGFGGRLLTLVPRP